MDKIRDMGKPPAASASGNDQNVSEVNITIKGNLQCIMVFAPKDMPGVSISRHDVKTVNESPYPAEQH